MPSLLAERAQFKERLRPLIEKDMERGKGSGEAGQNDWRKKKGKKRSRLSRILRRPSFQKKVQSCFTDSISQ